MPRRALWGVAVLCLAVFAARALYLWLASPYDLSEDEAFYWEWSLRLDWSYATKGPGIAWAIWLATHLFGTSTAAVRMVAAVSGMIGGLAVGGLAAELSWSRNGDAARASRAGLVGAALFALAPVFQSTALLSTIDGPFVACWGLGAWGAWRALTGRSASGWLVLGAAVGVGFLFKYTILMLIPGVLVFALVARHRGGLALHARWKGLLGAAALITLLGLVPVAVWNAQHDWQTVRHLMGHLGMKGGDTVTPGTEAARVPYSPMWTLGLLGSQAGFIGPAIVACLIAGWRAVARRATAPADDRVWLFAWWIGAPVLLMYVALSFVAEPEGNWPIAAWVTMLAGSAVYFTEAATAGGLRVHLWRATLWAGVVVGLGMARLDIVQKLVEPVSPALARAIPLGRVTGMVPMAEHVTEILKSLREQTGREPMVISQHYGRASRLRFYLPGRPVVWCSSSRNGGRVVQQDFWADTDLDDPALLGRPAVLIGGDTKGTLWNRAFETVTLIGDLRGEPKKNRPSFIGFGYRGFGPRHGFTPVGTPQGGH